METSIEVVSPIPLYDERISSSRITLAGMGLQIVASTDVQSSRDISSDLHESSATNSNHQYAHQCESQPPVADDVPIPSDRGPPPKGGPDALAVKHSSELQEGENQDSSDSVPPIGAVRVLEERESLEFSIPPVTSDAPRDEVGLLGAAPSDADGCSSSPPRMQLLLTLTHPKRCDCRINRAKPNGFQSAEFEQIRLVPNGHEVNSPPVSHKLGLVTEADEVSVDGSGVAFEYEILSDGTSSCPSTPSTSTPSTTRSSMSQPPPSPTMSPTSRARPLVCQQQHFSKENTLFIFDWDDTLLPSTWLLENGFVPDALLQLPSNVVETLDQVAAASRRTLELASTHGTVVIVTNAEEGWVELSCRVFMPKLLPYLDNFRRLSARSIYEKKSSSSPLAWKRLAFRDEIVRHFGRLERPSAGSMSRRVRKGKRKRSTIAEASISNCPLLKEPIEIVEDAKDDGKCALGSCQRPVKRRRGVDGQEVPPSGNSTTSASPPPLRNLISLGDSTHERSALIAATRVAVGEQAAKAELWSRNCPYVVKSVKLLDSPDVQLLKKQHELILTCLGVIAQFTNHLDLTVRLQQDASDTVDVGGGEGEELTEENSGRIVLKTASI